MPHSSLYDSALEMIQGPTSSKFCKGGQEISVATLPQSCNHASIHSGLKTQAVNIARNPSASGMGQKFGLKDEKERKESNLSMTDDEGENEEDSIEVDGDEEDDEDSREVEVDGDEEGDEDSSEVEADGDEEDDEDSSEVGVGGGEKDGRMTDSGEEDASMTDLIAVLNVFSTLIYALALESFDNLPTNDSLTLASQLVAASA